MKIKYKLLVYIIGIHLLLLALSIPLVRANSLWIIAIEAVIFASFFISIRLYRLITKPLEFSVFGSETLKSKDFSNKFVLTGNYEIDMLVQVYNKMIDQLREERIITEEKNFFLEKLIESSPVGIITLDYDQRISSLNPAAADILKLEQESIVGKTLHDTGHHLLVRLNQCELDHNFTFSLNGAQKYKCYKSHFINRGFARQFIIFEELTHEILEAEKYAYAKVIRMMSHEVNNTVGAVNSLLDTVRFYKKDLPDVKQAEYDNIINVAAERNFNMGVFISNFANVIRLPKPELKEYDLTILIRKAILLIQAMKLEKDIDILVTGIEEEFILKIDPIQMEQVLMNILKNAIESVPNPGNIQIILLKKERNLIIRDNGKGISEENAQKIFTPFFSTKPRGQGIGLTLIREVLVNHSFKFSLSTKPDGFTDFEIKFDN